MEIELVSGRITISDPCYTPGTWCAAKLGRIKPGIYNCYAHMEERGLLGKRVAEISIVHKNTELLHNPVWFEVDAEIGVDSGQCGIFESDYYEDVHGSQLDEIWYKKICNLTSPFGVIDDKGFVSSTGYGDGSYIAYYHETLEDDGYKENLIDAIKVVFIPEDEPDDFDMDLDLEEAA